jgi:DUF1365 family protein
MRADCAWFGTVVHRRKTPVAHAFRYRIGMVCLDVADTRGATDLAPLFGRERRGLVSWYRRDHFGDPGISLDSAVRQLVRERTGLRLEGPIHLLTSPRVFGYGFNPISFFFCHDAAGALECIVAEVTNTPWGERHCYVLPVSARHRGYRVLRFDCRKQLHVSPFLGMSQDYRWRIGLDEDRLSVGIAAATGRGRPFAAAMQLSRAPLRRASALRFLIQPPFGPAGTMAGIHYEALRLWWKGAPYHQPPEHAAATSSAADSPRCIFMRSSPFGETGSSPFGETGGSPFGETQSR